MKEEKKVLKNDLGKNISTAENAIPQVNESMSFVSESLSKTRKAIEMFEKLATAHIVKDNLNNSKPPHSKSEVIKSYPAPDVAAPVFENFETKNDEIIETQENEEEIKVIDEIVENSDKEFVIKDEHIEKINNDCKNLSIESKKTQEIITKNENEESEITDKNIEILVENDNKKYQKEIDNDLLFETDKKNIDSNEVLPELKDEIKIDFESERVEKKILTTVKQNKSVKSRITLHDLQKSIKQVLDAQRDEVLKSKKMIMEDHDKNIEEFKSQLNLSNAESKEESEKSEEGFKDTLNTNNQLISNKKGKVVGEIIKKTVTSGDKERRSLTKDDILTAKTIKKLQEKAENVEVTKNNVRINYLPDVKVLSRKEILRNQSRVDINKINENIKSESPSDINEYSIEKEYIEMARSETKISKQNDVDIVYNSDEIKKTKKVSFWARLFMCGCI